MSGPLPFAFTWRKAIAASALPSTVRHVAHALSLHMNGDGGSCFPGVELLAEETGLGASTVRASTKELEEAGFVMRQRRGRGKTMLYRPVLPDSRPPDPGALRPPDASGHEVKTARSEHQDRQDPAVQTASIWRQGSQLKGDREEDREEELLRANARRQELNRFIERLEWACSECPEDQKMVSEYRREIAKWQAQLRDLDRLEVAA